MITEIQRDSIIKAIGKNHISKIYDWLKTTDFKSIYGREVSKGMISKVLNGTWDNEIIETEEVVSDTSPISRFDFAQILTQMPRYQANVQRLLDWDRDYEELK
uniref:hypothetical protein n=1 Tax=Croceibacter atlanticus TaxID=313588 RepID=UPI0032B1F847